MFCFQNIIMWAIRILTLNIAFFFKENLLPVYMVLHLDERLHLAGTHTLIQDQVAFKKKYRLCCSGKKKIFEILAIIESGYYILFEIWIIYFSAFPREVVNQICYRLVFLFKTLFNEVLANFSVDCNDFFFKLC